MPSESRRRYRADFYLFASFLMGMGTFTDEKVFSPTSMKIIFGVNRPFRIRLDGRWYSARAALTGGSVPHFVNGEGDWQIVLWIDPESSLGDLLSFRLLRDRAWAVHDVPSGSAMAEVIQTAGDNPDHRGALEMAEALIRVYSGARPVPAIWDDTVKGVVAAIGEDPGGTTVRSLTERTGWTPEELHADFRRVTGCRLDDYLYRIKWSAYIGLRGQGVDRPDALRRAGLPGWNGLRDGFEDIYGLDLAVLEDRLPFVRVFPGSLDEPFLYL